MKKIISLAIAVVNTAIASYASELNVYPVQAVFTSQNVNNSAFSKVLSRHREDFIKEYITQFDKYFPNANKEISEKTKYKAFVSYVNVPRASQYTVKKSEHLLDIYLPLTMSINFVNMATGETLYSYPVTNYFKYETTIESDIKKREEKIVSLTKQNYEQTLAEVIKQASIDFKPFDIVAKVKDTYKHLYVLDKGLESGITKGDLLTDENMNQISVIYSDLNYSVAEKILGKPSADSNFSKFVNCNISQLKKTKILFINDFDNEKIYNLFSSAIGNNADFSIITTDKTFYDMQTALISLNDNFSITNTQKREIPDYFLKLSFTTPLFAIYPTNKSFFNIHRYGILVCGHIIDNQGNVVYASCVNDEITDEVVSDIKFSDEAQYEIVTKNAFSKIATDIATNVKFKSVTIEIDKVKDDTIELTDNNNLLNIGNDVTVMKKVKSDELDTDVIIPTWTYKVIDIKENTVICEKVHSLIDDLPNPSRRDFIKINAITKSKTRTNSYDFLIGNSEINGNEVSLKYFDIVAFNTISSKLNLPISVNKTILAAQINDLNNGYGFKRKISIPTQKSKNFINVKYKANLLKEKQKGNLIEQTYGIICGLVINNGDKKDEKKIGLKQEVTFSVPPTKDKKIIEYELLIKLKELMLKVAEDFNSSER